MIELWCLLKNEFIVLLLCSCNPPLEVWMVVGGLTKGVWLALWHWWNVHLHIALGWDVESISSDRDIRSETVRTDSRAWSREWIHRSTWIGPGRLFLNQVAGALAINRGHFLTLFLDSTLLNSDLVSFETNVTHLDQFLARWFFDHHYVGKSSEWNIATAFNAHENSIDFTVLREQFEDLLLGGILGWETLNKKLLFLKYLVILSSVSLVHGVSSNDCSTSD